MKLSGFLVSNPRDTIYAFLGMSKDSSRSEGAVLGPEEQILKPDYKKNPVQVYIDFVRYVISKTRFLDILCRQWASPSSQRSQGVDSEAGRVPRHSFPTWIRAMDPSTAYSTFLDESGECICACVETLLF